MNNFISLEDYQGTLIEKSFKDKSTLIQKKVSVIRGGKFYVMTVWVKPEGFKKERKLNILLEPIANSDGVIDIAEVKEKIVDNKGVLKRAVVANNEGKYNFKPSSVEDTNNEAAAYEVSQSVGVNCVPATAELESEKFEKGSYQRFVEGVELSKIAVEKGLSLYSEPYEHTEYSKVKIARSNFLKKYGEQYKELYLFDGFIGNPDRNGKNSIIDKKDRVWAIDNGEAFQSERHQFNVGIFPIKSLLKEKISDSVIKKYLKVDFSKVNLSEDKRMFLKSQQKILVSFKGKNSTLQDVLEGLGVDLVKSQKD